MNITTRTFRFFPPAFFVTAIAVSTMALFGCSGKSVTQRAIEKAAKEKGVEVKEGENGSVEVKTKDGSFSSSAKVPKDFPKDVPLPKGKISTSISSNSDGKKAWVVATEVKDLGKSIDELKSSLKEKGYTIESDTSSDTNGTVAFVFVAKKGEDNVSVFGTSSADQKPTVSVSVERKA
jgi:hypothetical protein